MRLPKRYNPKTREPELQEFWQKNGTYEFDSTSDSPIYSIDTPPPTVSGFLHMGHVYSYCHADFMARFMRMNGYNVYYPMGFDDNGLPTERLVERTLGIKATEVGRQNFIRKCLEVSEEIESKYRTLYERLGLSIDWRYTYRTIEDRSRHISQWSFIDLYKKGLACRRQAPTIWCPHCQTAIAQAEVDDLSRESQFVTMPFRLENGETVRIATTRPELLPACVAVFVHPDDARYRDVVGQQVTVPVFGQQVPLLIDEGADPEKGTGAVMCCTFGDTADVAWWHTHNLPLHSIIGLDGCLRDGGGVLAGLTIPMARQRIVEILDESGLLLNRQPVTQSVRVHDRCDTPVEYIVTPQWYIRLLDSKDKLLEAGEQLNWYPPQMKSRYRSWVENLGWDWGISRQRYFGVPFPVWYCDKCGQEIVADEEQLPVDPTEQLPPRACDCGSSSFTPETDVFDTWATSSVSPLIASQWLADDALYAQNFPMSMRPQAHEIIRTWAFYTVTKSLYHFDRLPWQDVFISGWGLAPEGSGKISKSRGGGPIAPMDAIEQYSADGVRYWTASTGLGKDSVISEEKMRNGYKLVTKLWNVARFSQRFLIEPISTPNGAYPSLSPADQWILSRTQRLIERATSAFQEYDYATAKNETELFFWTQLADNYLEMAKQRLYSGSMESELYEGASYTLYQSLLTVLKLFAPFMPYVTEKIYQGIFAESDGSDSIHHSSWPTVDKALINETAEAVGEMLIDVATAARRYKSERQLSLGTKLAGLHLATQNQELAQALRQAAEDIMSITRAESVKVVESLDEDLEVLFTNGEVVVGLDP